MSELRESLHSYSISLKNSDNTMIDRLQISGKGMTDEVVHDKLLLTW